MARTLSDEYNIPVNYRPLNDLEIQQRKIGGFGGYIVGDAYIFYGFYQAKRADLETAAKVLKTPPEKIADKGVTTTVERMCCIEEAAGREIPWEEFKNALKKEAGDTLVLSLCLESLQTTKKNSLRKTGK